MKSDLTEEIGRIKPLADAVVDAASALNAAIQAASAEGLSVRIEVPDQWSDGDGERVPVVRARVSKRIA